MIYRLRVKVTIGFRLLYDAEPIGNEGKLPQWTLPLHCTSTGAAIPARPMEP